MYPKDIHYVEYSGNISRQALVEFCRSKVVEINEARRAYGSVLDAEDLPDDDKESIHSADALEIGKQLAYRAVCEWAKDYANE